MKDELGERMKEFYENRTRYTLPRRTFTVIRLDGKAFHTYTKGFERPYDLGLMRIMDRTAIALCEQIQGAKLAFVQSDEISIIVTDFEDIKTDAWFDGNVQKISSVSASIATAHFNALILHNLAEEALSGDKQADIDLTAAHAYCLKPAYFDSRVFTIPEMDEVINYLIWRQQDATRNSIQMGAQSMYSQRQLHGMNTSALQELMFKKGINWDKYPIGFKRGRVIVKEKYWAQNTNPKAIDYGTVGGWHTRNRWAVKDPPVFTADRGFVIGTILTEPIAPPLEAK
jgi:tRNA(His) guanylyltransferase